MNAPLVSVLISVRNGETVVAETLNSVFRRSHSNLQVVVVDNGSTDRTVEVVRECFADAPCDCTLAECAEPGANRARNVAYELARGDFVQWLDAGDQIHEEKKERQLAAFAKNDEAVIAVGDWIWRVQLRGTNRQGTVDLMQRLSLSAPWGEPKWRKQGSFAERRFVQPHHHDFLLRLLEDTRGWARFQLGRLQEARQDQQWAASNSADVPGVHYRLAKVLQALGENKAALAAVEHALSLKKHFSDRRAAEALHRELSAL